MIKIIFAALLIGLTLPAAAQAQSETEPAAKAAVPQPAHSGQAQDADAIVCRPPQQLPGQRLYGPRVCKPQRQWDDLHRQGMDVGPDGESVVASEKFRTVHGCNGALAC